MAIVQPGNADETRALLRWAVEDARRRASRSGSRSARRRGASSSRRVAPGRGAVLREGADALLFAYGPVMLHEALTAAELLGDACRS